MAIHPSHEKRHRCYLEMVQLLVQSFPATCVPFDVIFEAAVHGRSEILQWLYENHNYIAFIDSFGKSNQLAVAALEKGYLHLAKWFLLQITHEIAGWVTAAVKSGDIEAVKWAYGLSGRGIEPGAIDAAVRGGHIEIFRWLVNTLDTFVDLSTLVSRALFAEVEWMLTNHPRKCIGFKRAINEAAGRGRLHVIHLLLLGEPTRGVGWTADTMDFAAANGHLEAMKWLHSNRSDISSSNAIVRAAENGHLEVIKWLSSNRTEGCTTQVIAANGHFDELKWLHHSRHKGCINAVDVAAKNGHLHVVKWLIENRSEGGSANAIDFAATGGHIDIVQFLSTKTRQRCTTAAMNGAASNGHLNVVKWLHLNRNEGCTNWAMDGAAGNGHMKVVQWLHANRVEGCTTAAMDLAARNGHFFMVKWLHENRHEGCTGTMLYRVVNSGHFDIVMLLVLKYPECDILQCEQGLGFFDWLYSHRPPEFVSSFLKRYGSSNKWLCLFQEAARI